MIRKSPNGDLPVIRETAYVDNATRRSSAARWWLYENVFTGSYAVIRADEVDKKGELEAIVIGAHANIQGGAAIHSKAGGLAHIGRHTSMAHRSIVHGPCGVGDNVFTGFNPVLFNCAVGDRSVARANQELVKGCKKSQNEF